MSYSADIAYYLQYTIALYHIKHSQQYHIKHDGNLEYMDIMVRMGSDEKSEHIRVNDALYNWAEVSCVRVIL